MGNQLAAATVVNVSDVTSSLELIAPLSCMHRNYFRSFRCSKEASAAVPSDTLRSLYSFSRGDNRDQSALHHRPSNRGGSTEVVLKVFVRTLYNEEEQKVVEFCYNHLLSIERRMAGAKPANMQNTGSCETAASNGSSHDSSNCGVATTPPPCNVLFYSCMEIQNDRFCMLQRPYVAFSLAERLATRPYWSTANRLFATYQLLQGTVQLHEVWGTVHGDLKVDNILVNTSGWLYITDICPFNPALLPANNPALFNYFYDTNESHICSLAPEKFVDHPTNVNTSNLNATVHTPGMDIFSLACVVVYIFTEEPLFRLSEVLELRSLQTQREREEMINSILRERGLAPNLCRMLSDMLCTNPNSRPTSRQLLERYTPTVFPPYFEYLYRDILPALLPRPPEHQVQLLWSRLDDIFAEVECRGSFNSGGGSGHNGEADDGEFPPLVPSSDAKKVTVLVLIPIILNAGLHLMASETCCRVVSIVQRILPHCTLEVQADVILPYMLRFLRTETLPVVARVLALRTLSTICHNIPFSTGEATVFDDLILPCVEDLVAKADTQNVTLLLEVAAQLPSLFLMARSFMEQQQALVTSNERQSTYGEQLNRLLERGWDALRTLYKHNHSAVVIAALQRSVDVVKFLGEERTQHDFIPFLTTAIASTIDVQRELYPQAILCHTNLQRPPLKTLRFFVEEALRRTDAIILRRAIESVSVVASSKLVDVSDVMSLAECVLPHILDKDKWVSLAARQLVEVVAQTYRMSDVCTRLPSTLIPLLRYKVPFSTLTSLPEELVNEISQRPSFSLRHRDERPTVRVVGGDSKLSRRFMNGSRSSDNSITERNVINGGAGGFVQCQSNYILQHGTTKRFPPNFPLRAAFFDVTFDPSVRAGTPSALDAAAVHDSSDATAAYAWGLTFKPTHREKKRLLLRQQTYTNRVDSNGDIVGGALFTSTTESTTGRRPWLLGPPTGSLSVQPSPALYPGVTWADKELKPIAAPYFTRRAHSGAIYSSATVGSGTLVTAGGKGEALLWSVTATGVNLSSRLNVGDASSKNTFLFVHFARGGVSPLLCIGGTDGTWQLCDIASNKVVQERKLDGSPLTAACALSEDVMLVSSALGGLFAMDYRAGREVWKSGSILPVEFGTISGVYPLCSECRAYGAAVTTMGGGVALFDLRFELLLQKHWLHGAPIQGSRSIDNPYAILCVSPDAACKPVHQLNEHPGLLLGTRSGMVYHMDLISGRSCVSLRPATPNNPTRAMLLQPRHRLLFTAGDDMQIRRWCLSNSALSSTVVFPPYNSYAYARRTSGSTMEVRPSSKSSNGQLAPTAAGATTAVSAPLVRPVVPQHHSDAILTLCGVSVSGGDETYLVSGSRDGQLTLWFNAE
ncbi:protein kinase, putative [Trypanosoma equiperdum]|uniref:non-specific serine/threonine protein kinase n=1 Tax=Trypanosoma equiperdum TaxID=5694 RepID=A0A1G4I1N8_TRYEQ|nr:protein kinase, putative [Trypanosoma equiperdum]